MKNSLVFILTLILTAYSSTFGDVFSTKTTLKELEKELPKLDSITCKYSQEKVLANSKIVLKSGGNFQFEKDKGITFYTTYPTKITTNYTNKEYKQINSIIKAVSNKQYSKLEKEFDFYFENFKKEQNWVLGLKPKQNTPSFNYLTSIQIEGNKDISKIIIISKDKTKTTLRFFK